MTSILRSMGFSIAEDAEDGDLELLALGLGGWDVCKNAAIPSDLFSLTTVELGGTFGLIKLVYEPNDEAVAEKDKKKLGKQERLESATFGKNLQSFNNLLFPLQRYMVALLFSLTVDDEQLPLEVMPLIESLGCPTDPAQLLQAQCLPFRMVRIGVLNSILSKDVVQAELRNSLCKYQDALQATCGSNRKEIVATLLKLLRGSTSGTDLIEEVLRDLFALLDNENMRVVLGKGWWMARLYDLVEEGVFLQNGWITKSKG